MKTLIRAKSDARRIIAGPDAASGGYAGHVCFRRDCPLKLGRPAVGGEAAPCPPGPLVDREHLRVSYRGRTSEELAVCEFGIVSMLLKAYPQPASRSALCTTLRCGAGGEQADLNLNVRVSRLKRKLPPLLARCIQSVRGCGYRIALPSA